MDISTYYIIFTIFTIANLSFIIWGVRKHTIKEREKLKRLGKFASGIEIRWMDSFFEFVCEYKGLPIILILINDVLLAIILSHIAHFYGYVPPCYP